MGVHPLLYIKHSVIYNTHLIHSPFNDNFMALHTQSTPHIIQSIFTLNDRTMPKSYCYLSQKTILQLEQIKQDEGYDSSSQVMKEMIALGIQIYERNKGAAGMSDEEKRKFEKEEELKAQHTTYLLRLLGFSTDILRCVYDKEKLNAQHDNAEDHISNIKKKVDHFIDGYIQN